MLARLEAFLDSIMQDPVTSLEDVPEPGSDIDPETIVLRNELYDQVGNAISRLKSADEQLVIEVYFQGRTIREIADKTGKNVDGLHRKLKRALRKIAQDPHLKAYFSS